MKVLWTVNTPIGPLGELLYGKKTNGAWMDALLESMKRTPTVKLAVATTANISDTRSVVEDGIEYFALPSSVPLLYDENKQQNIDAWKALINKVQPDLIQVWGTEFGHSLCALQVASGIPSVIYMQGFLGSIARHYLAGMTHSEIVRNITIRDILKRDNILQQQKKYQQAARRETKMFLASGRIISENEWCNMSVRSVAPDVKIYHCPLSINICFASKKWSAEKANKHTVICNASGYPLKGLHMLLRAIALLKERYPDIQLRIPGNKVISDGSLKGILRERGYSKYIERLIKELHLEQNIEWLGMLSPKQLASEYEKANVFVLCSSIENHSSSLKEAMMAGTPCVASAVGGIPEYVIHGENGFLYRFGEYDILSEYIAKIFENRELAEKISHAAREDMIKRHSEEKTANRIIDIYHEILGTQT